MKDIKFTYLEDSDKRIDNFFEYFGFESRSSFQETIKNGLVKVSGKPIKANYKLRCFDSIAIEFLPEEKYSTESIFVPVLFENENCYVLNKPPFLAVHRAKSYKKASLVDYMRDNNFTLSTGEDEYRPGIVHRLDADTSGAIIIAKNDLFHQKLKAEFQNKIITKKYYALVYGVPKENVFVIKKSIGRSKNPIKMGIVEGGREAISNVELISTNGEYSLLNVRILTGRTHQIRVHLSSINLPIVGDKLYGIKNKILADRQMLHAHYLRFMDPISGDEIEVKAPMFKDMVDAIKKAQL